MASALFRTPRSIHPSRWTRLQSKISTNLGRGFSTEENTPLFLWLKDGSESPSAVPAPRILIPPTALSSTRITVDSPSDVLSAVEKHYSLSSDSTQFVGGMGESDAGVWFVSESVDPLQRWNLVQESIQLVKTSRHGVPFGIFTSGIGLPKDLPPLGELGLASVQVSLLADNPQNYAKATGLSASEAANLFGEVCNFCATSTENGFPVEAAVLQPYAGAARDLATALGAIQVQVYPDE